MGLEAVTYVADLISTNPLSSDLESQGDDHLRLIKLALKNTLKNGSRGEYFQRSVTVAANQTLVLADDKKVYAISTAGAARTVTLPTLTAADDGWMVAIIKSTTDTNDVVISPVSGTISGLASVTLHAGYQVAVLLWTGTVWVLRGIDKWAPLRLYALTADTALTNLHFGSLITVTPATAIVTLTLPTAVGSEGLSMLVERRGTSYNVVLDGLAAETINGITTYTLTKDRQVVWIISDGANWRILMVFSGSTGLPAFTDIVQTFSAVQTFSKAVIYTEQTLTDGATINWNLDSGPNAKVTLGGNRTLANPTQENLGQHGTLRVIQDGTGGRTLTWGAAYKFTGNDDGRPDPTANATTLYRYWVRGTDDVLMDRVYMSSSDSIGFFKEYTADNPYAVSTTKTVAHGLGRHPSLIVAYLECLTAELGWAVGDRVLVPLGDRSSTNSMLSIGHNVTNFYTVTAVTGAAILNRTTQAAANITPANWKLMVRVYE